MKERFVQLHKGYLLRCQPVETPTGEFIAELRVLLAARRAGGEWAMTPTHKPFATQRAAADYALSVGMQWVDQSRSVAI